jgi:excinuclease ABC subunit C
MLDESGEVIYVGKAKALKNRVTSYFRGEHEPKTAAMVEKVRDFNVIVAASEFEALVLENSLIKRHQPHYNILLRDDKAYPFVRLDVKSTCPRFTIANKVSQDGAKYFGPYGGRMITKDIINTICKAMKLPTCGKKFPRDFGRGRVCLNYHMGACLGYCAGRGDQDTYMTAIRSAEMILNGKTAQLRAELEAEMERAADELRFEQAAQARDKLKAIEGLSNSQRVIAGNAVSSDAVGFFRGAKSCFAVLHYADGDLVAKDYELFDEPLEDDSEAVSALVRQYYAIRGLWPRTIFLPCDTEDMEDIAQLLTEASGHKVTVEAPKRGEKHLLVEKANINAREESVRVTTAAERRLKTLEWLRDALGLENPPRRIEAFDISNTGDFGIVAAMTVFADGKPSKGNYRKFRIKNSEHQDDYASMHEAVSRRFARYTRDDEKFNELPDLLLIDGGENHAEIAGRVLADMQISLPVLGMVKDERHRTRALVFPDGREVGITGNPAAFALIGNIQEETHRFAIEYHRSLRSAAIGSRLDDISGVGATRRNQLLKHFKTIKAISGASLEELAEVVPKNTAQAVYEHFRQGKAAGADLTMQDVEENEE